LGSTLYFGLRLFLGQGYVEDDSQPFVKILSLFCGRGILEEILQQFSLLSTQVFRIFEKGLHASLEFFVLFFR
jgi:hypothetical protein